MAFKIWNALVFEFSRKIFIIESSGYPLGGGGFLANYDGLNPTSTRRGF